MTETQEWNDGKGTATISRWQADAIKLAYVDSRFTEPMVFPASRDDDVVRMHFGIHGNYNFAHQQLNQSFENIGGHHNIMYSKGFDIVVENKSLALETFGIQFPKALFIQYTANTNAPLQRFAENILAGKSCLLAENWQALDLSILQVIQQIIHCPYSGAMKKLFLLSKSLELLVLTAESLTAEQQQRSGKSPFIKNKTDLEKIIAVRDLVDNRLDAPPSIPEIAKLVGLNEYKLKGGFKETFQTTIFAYLREQRLHLAHRYLRDTNKLAANIAAELGYSSPQHFSQSFKQKFGYSPASIRKNP